MPVPPRFIATLLIAALVGVRTADAACGTLNCPIDTYTVEELKPGWIRIDFLYEYIDQNQPRIGRRNASVGEISGHHDEIETLSEIRRLRLTGGLTSRLDVSAELPFIHREHRHIHHHHGADLREAWNFDGLGDLRLLAHLEIFRPDRGAALPRLSVIAGGEIPTGRDRATNSDGSEAEVGILPSDGAAALIVGLSSVQNFSVTTANGRSATMPIFASGTYRWNDEGRENYRIGGAGIMSVGLIYPVLPKVGLMAQANLRVQRRDDPGGTAEEVDKTGGTFVYASPGLQLTLADNLWSFLYVQIPVYQRVNAIQLTSAANLVAGFSYRFNVLD